VRVPVIMCVPVVMPVVMRVPMCAIVIMAVYVIVRVVMSMSVVGCRRCRLLCDPDGRRFGRNADACAVQTGIAGRLAGDGQRLRNNRLD
jgi:hypothetical protein